MDVANAIVLGAWGLFAISVVLRASRRGSATFDDQLDLNDRRLVGGIAFYLAVPALVLGAQAIQLGIAAALGAQMHFETWIYFGIVEPTFGQRLTPLARAGIAAAEPVSLALLAALLVAWTRLSPANAARNLLRLEVARVLLVLAFGLQPILSLLIGRGDFAIIREALNARYPDSGEVALLSYGILGAWAFWRWRGARRLHALASSAHDAARRAGQRLDAAPDDPAALRALGAAQLASGDPRALETLEHAREKAPEDASIELLLGRAHLDRGRAELAAERLRHAGLLLEDQGDDDGLLVEVTLALSAARIALGDADGALMTAQAAQEQAPRDPRALLMIADALALGGRADEARAQLEGALEEASGALRREIERRLASLTRRP